ncbi:MAG: hypothetical protein WAL83_13160 [Arenicellales bacterium]
MGSWETRFDFGHDAFPLDYTTFLNVLSLALSVWPYARADRLGRRAVAVAGCHVQRVDLTLTGGGRDLELYRASLEDAVITRLDNSIPRRERQRGLGLAFARIRWRFALWRVSGQSRGTLHGCWDVAAIRAC